MLDELIAEFEHPSNQYRGQPFWSWNGKLEPEELRRQIRLMARMGLGGFFMHSRVGLATPYLQEPWFEAIKACVDEARKLGMLAWLYDEDRWPSGAAGGLVTQDPRLRKRTLVMHELTDATGWSWDDATVAAFTAKAEGALATDVQQVARGVVPELPPDSVLLTFRVAVAEPSESFNGNTYIDILNHEAVERFIEITHEAYAARFSDDFGTVIPGIFCDEPAPPVRMLFDPECGGYSAPWTDGLPDIFLERYGYDLVPRLPELFFDVDGQAITPARRDYHDCVTFLFVDVFARQISEWCEQHNLIHIGHVLLEESLAVQTYTAGSCMRFYEHLQAPGIDLLTEHWRPHTNGKQVSSVARQFGRKWRITETYGCTGWDFPLVGHKALSDWQLALGINLRCQHLAWYTMEGEAKRDYPAGIFYQSPWWEIYPKVEDYFARLHSAMTRGTEVRDVLVIHPVESMWTLVRKGWLGVNYTEKSSEVRAYDEMLVELENTLFAAHLDFDYGDEDILARHGTVARGPSGPCLRVGEADYSVVVVPPLRTVRRTTLDLLRRFRDEGGTVIFAGEPATYVDALPSDDVLAVAAQCLQTPASGPELAGAVAPLGRRIAISDGEGVPLKAVLYLLREDDDGFYLFLSNTGDDLSEQHLDPLQQPGLLERTLAYRDVRVRGLGACAGSPLELDPDTGKVYRAEAVRGAGGDWEVCTSLPRFGSRLFAFPKRASTTGYPARSIYEEVSRAVLDDEMWPILRSEPNCLPLDRARFRIGEGDWHGPEEILRIDRMVREALSLKPRGGAMFQPWARAPREDGPQISVELRYTFEATSLPTGGLYLGLEQPHRFGIAVNGVEITADMDSGWWVDPSLRKIPINASLLRRGTNEIALSGVYDEAYPGLEIVYLLGNFGTSVRGTKQVITEEPRQLRLGSWVDQGLTFYSGTVSYCTTFEVSPADGERCYVQVPEYAGSAVRVIVNGTAAGVIVWEPQELDITEWVTRGRNELRVEVFSHRRNSHGPLHLAEERPFAIGPGHFVTTGEQWTDEYRLVPVGLLQGPVVVTRRARR